MYHIQLFKEKNNDICQICYSDFVTDNLTCNICKNKICINCCNNLKSRCFRIPVNCNNDKIDEYSKDSMNICYLYDCPFCRNKNTENITKFSKEEIIELTKKDYYKNIGIDSSLILLKNIEIIINNFQNNPEKYSKYIYIKKILNRNIQLEKDYKKSCNDLSFYKTDRLATKKAIVLEKIKNNELIDQYNSLLLEFNSLNEKFKDITTKICTKGMSKKNISLYIKKKL
jgi:hypothetical protein